MIDTPSFFPRVLRERLAPKRLQVKSRPILWGGMRLLPLGLHHLETLSQMCLNAMTHLMRPRVRSLLWHPNMRYLNWFLISPTGCAFMLLSDLRGCQDAKWQDGDDSVGPCWVAISNRESSYTPWGVELVYPPQAWVDGSYFGYIYRGDFSRVLCLLCVESQRFFGQAIETF